MSNTGVYRRLFGADKGTRTLDIQLGKLALYQLSYVRLLGRHHGKSACKVPCILSEQRGKVKPRAKKPDARLREEVSYNEPIYLYVSPQWKHNHSTALLCVAVLSIWHHAQVNPDVN